MRFSVIMPSRLTDYPNAAEFRDQKLVRAINSVLDQTLTDLELIVIADSCELTKSIVSSFADKRLRLTECRHKAIFDNTPRNTGIEKAEGDYILYLDSDDWWGPEHLEIINRNLKSYDWVWFNDIINREGWTERYCSIKISGQCGTSNICHSRKLGLTWDRPGYGHDYYFIQKLLMNKNYTKIETPEYFVCHIPMAGGYDL